MHLFYGQTTQAEPVQHGGTGWRALRLLPQWVQLRVPGGQAVTEALVGMRGKQVL